MPNSSSWGEGFFDNFVGHEESLTDELEAARKSMVLDPFKPDGGRVGFFEDKTHFGVHPKAPPGGSDGAIFCGGGRDTANKLGGDHSGSKLQNEIVNPIEQSAQEPCGKINNHITIMYDVIWLEVIVKEKSFGAQHLAFGDPLTPFIHRQLRTGTGSGKSKTGTPLHIVDVGLRS
jgi:hypothetical protein